MQVIVGSCKDMTWIPSGMDSMLNERFQYSTSLLSSLSSLEPVSTLRDDQADSASSRYSQKGNARSSTRSLVNGALQLPVDDHSRRNPRSKCVRGERRSGRDSRAHDWPERGLFPRSHRSSTRDHYPVGRRGSGTRIKYPTNWCGGGSKEWNYLPMNRGIPAHCAVGGPFPGENRP